MAEFTPEELATINEIMREESVAALAPEEMQMMRQQIRAAMTPEEMQMMLREESVAAITPEEMQMMQMMQMQPVQPQNFGALPPKESGAAMTPEEMQMQMRQQSGAATTPQEMQGEQGKAQYLQQQIEAIRSRMGGGAPQTGSQRVMDAMGALPAQQAGSAMTDQEIAMMRGQR